MKPRVSLLTKILGWFFLNLLILALAGFVFLSFQFRVGAEFLLSGQGGERLQTVSRLIAAELNSRPRPDWNEILERFTKAHPGAKFLLYRPDGVQAAGEATLLPPAVVERIRPRPAFNQPENNPGRPPERDFNDNQGKSRVREPGPRRPPETPLQPRFIVRTEQPRLYWIGQRLQLIRPNPERMPVPMILVVVSNNLRAGGLLVDLTFWLWVALGAVLFSILFWLPLVRNITRSVSQMQSATKEFAEGKFETRVDEYRSDELGALGAAINQMATRLSGFVSGQKRFLGDIAHELCSPIARMQLAVSILEERADEKQKPYVEDLREEIQEISGLVNELLSFSKASLGAANVRLQRISVKPLLEKAVRREAPEGTQIELMAEPNLECLAEPELILRAVSNLIRNAVHYAAAAGPITVSAQQQEEGWVEIRVTDSGGGVPEADLAKLFDPFYRVDPSRTRETGGVGLGLSIVKTCVESCGGTAICQNLTPKGFEVILRLVAADVSPL